MTDYKTLITKLRETPFWSKRELYYDAADTIEALVADISRIGGCVTCKHRGRETCDYVCSKCEEKCVCYRCRESSLYEWRGVQHDRD